MQAIDRLERRSKIKIKTKRLVFGFEEDMEIAI
jgi:hypothetical protein